MARKRQDGQVLLLLVVALGLFLLGAVGLAIDASVLYSHRQLAQAAADAAAEAAIMSVFNGTNTSTYANVFGSTAFTCTTGNDSRTPCVYARYHGFGTTANETVTVDFPTSVPGVTLSDEDDPAAIGVTVSRTVDTGLIRFVGQSLATVRARGVAVITDVFSPVPIIILHPTFGPGVGGGGPSDAAFEKNGDNTVKICGGPTKSIQVNSDHKTQAVRHVGQGAVDLSKAGPKNFVNIMSCNGAGADFGQFGGPNPYSQSTALWLGTDGNFQQPSSRLDDPLRNVPQPVQPTAAPAPGLIDGGGATIDCPVPAGYKCKVYSPGYYPTGIQIKNEFAVFKPGLYYMGSGGFQIQANGAAHMQRTCQTPDPATFGCGMLIVNDGNSAKDDIFFIAANSGKSPSYGGPFTYIYPDLTTCTGNCLLGTTESGIYKGILFFEDRTSPYKKHQLSGGGGLTLRGTIYLTKSDRDTLIANPSNYQYLTLSGNSGSSTRVIGMIIVDRLSLGGTSDIIMTLNPNASLNLRQVALAR